MFGYRLIRESDLTALRAELAAERARNDALYERVIRTSSEAAAKGGEAAIIMARVNALETEAATRRHKDTGLPQIAPQLHGTGGIGTPITSGPMSERLGVGLDIFADVGDTRADELRRAALLHDDEPVDAQPEARELLSNLVPAAGG